MSQQEKPHFSIGHMCAGCEISNFQHMGCVASRNVKIIKDKNPTNEEYLLIKEIKKTNTNK